MSLWSLVTLRSSCSRVGVVLTSSLSVGEVVAVVVLVVVGVLVLRLTTSLATLAARRGNSAPWNRKYLRKCFNDIFLSVMYLDCCEGMWWCIVHCLLQPWLCQDWSGETRSNLLEQTYWTMMMRWSTYSSLGRMRSGCGETSSWTGSRCLGSRGGSEVEMKNINSCRMFLFFYTSCMCCPVTAE